MRLKGLTIAASMLLCGQAFAINPFTLIEDGYPENKGALELENTLEFDYHLGSDHGYKSLNVEHEIEYGTLENLTLRVAGSYYYEDSKENNGMHFDAFKLEGQYYFTNPNIDNIGWSVVGAVEISEHSMNFEGIGVVQKDLDKWTFTANLGAAVSIDDVFEKGGDTSTSGSIFGGAGVTYSFTNTFRAGVNISAETSYDNLNNYAGTTVYVGPTFNWVPNEHLWITGGPSYQRTNEDEPKFLFGLIIGYYF